MGPPHWYVLTGTRNAVDRVRLLVLLREHTCSVKRIADVLELEYATVEEHLEILQENDLVEVRERDGTGRYRPTPQARQHWDAIPPLPEYSPSATSDQPGQIRSRRR